MKLLSLGPEPSASTNSAIRAKNIIYFTKIRYVSQLFIFFFFFAHKTYRIESFFISFSKGNIAVRPVTSESLLSAQKKVGAR